MAKSKPLETGPRDLPTGGELLVQNEIPLDPPTPQSASTAEVSIEVPLPLKFVGLEIALASCVPAGYLARRVDTTLNHDQAIVLRSLLFACQEQGSTLKNGKLVANAGDTVRWLLEQFSPAAKPVANESQ